MLKGDLGTINGRDGLSTAKVTPQKFTVAIVYLLFLTQPDKMADALSCNSSLETNFGAFQAANCKNRSSVNYQRLNEVLIKFEVQTKKLAVKTATLDTK